VQVLLLRLQRSYSQKKQPEQQVLELQVQLEQAELELQVEQAELEQQVLKVQLEQRVLSGQVELAEELLVEQAEQLLELHLEFPLQTLI
jgi:hypothetical protein